MSNICMCLYICNILYVDTTGNKACEVLVYVLLLNGNQTEPLVMEQTPIRHSLFIAHVQTTYSTELLLNCNIVFDRQHKYYNFLCFGYLTCYWCVWSGKQFWCAAERWMNVYGGHLHIEDWNAHQNSGLNRIPYGVDCLSGADLPWMNQSIWLWVDVGEKQRARQKKRESKRERETSVRNLRRLSRRLIYN